MQGARAKWGSHTAFLPRGCIQSRSALIRMIELDLVIRSIQLSFLAPVHQTKVFGRNISLHGSLFEASTRLRKRGIEMPMAIRLQ